MDTIKIGNQIATLRKNKNLTQNELGDRLGVSFQAVSKWERGETLPDTAILPALANVLETTIDFILLGSDKMINYKGKISVKNMIDGLKCLETMGLLLGKDNIIYSSAIKGINETLNTNIDEAFTNDYIFEAFVAEAIIQNLQAGAYVDISDVKNNLKYDHFKDIVIKFCSKFGIK